MPHFRATIEGLSMDEVDSLVREARVGVVTSGDVSNPANASGTPTEAPETESVEVSVDAPDRDEAWRKLTGALPEGTAIEILG